MGDDQDFDDDQNFGMDDNLDDQNIDGLDNLETNGGKTEDKSE